MLKMALLDCSINEKCCSFDGGRGICPLFSSSPRGIWQLKSPHPGNLPYKAKKMLMPGGHPGAGALGAAGIYWCIKLKQSFPIESKRPFTFRPKFKGAFDWPYSGIRIHSGLFQNSHSILSSIKRLFRFWNNARDITRRQRFSEGKYKFP